MKLSFSGLQMVMVKEVEEIIRILLKESHNKEAIYI